VRTGKSVIGAPFLPLQESGKGDATTKEATYTYMFASFADETFGALAARAAPGVQRVRPWPDAAVRETCFWFRADCQHFDTSLYYCTKGKECGRCREYRQRGRA